MAYIGVDLHSNSFTACRLDQDGSEAISTIWISVLFFIAPLCLRRYRWPRSAGPAPC